MRCSVVIPTHDRRPLLERAVASVLAQTHRELELIVVDDASSDDTEAFLASVRDPRVVVRRLSICGGAAASRNAGVATASGDLIAFLDDDDEMLPEFLDRTLHAWSEAGSDVGVGWCGTRTVLDGERGEQIVGEAIWRPRFATRGEAYRSFLRSRRIGTNCGVTVRRTCFDAVGGFDERMRKAEDTDFLTRIVRRFDFLVVPEVLIKVHRHQGGRLTVYDRGMAEAYEVILENHREAIEGDASLAAALQYKTGWLYFHAGDRRRARRHMWEALRRSPLFVKGWAGWFAFELGGRRAVAAHRGLSAAKARFLSGRRARRVDGTA